jgi:hypothetical protein
MLVRLYVILIIYFVSYYREGRNERQIDRPKDVLVSMRKDQTYRETKMRLLQKLAGLELLAEVLDELDEDVQTSGTRDWFDGIHRYTSKKAIVENFVKGTPISCFRSKSCDDTFYVACYGSHYTLTSLVELKSRASSMTAQECGHHFCKFVLAKEAGTNTVATMVVSKKNLSDLVGDYALLLPYSKKGQVFNTQYTVCYWDWHALCCDSPEPPKGFPQPDKDVFASEMIESLSKMAL